MGVLVLIDDILNSPWYFLSITTILNQVSLFIGAFDFQISVLPSIYPCREDFPKKIYLKKKTRINSNLSRDSYYQTRLMTKFPPLSLHGYQILAGAAGPGGGGGWVFFPYSFFLWTKKKTLHGKFLNIQFFYLRPTNFDDRWAHSYLTGFLSFFFFTFPQSTHVREYIGMRFLREKTCFRHITYRMQRLFCILAHRPGKEFIYPQGERTKIPSYIWLSIHTVFSRRKIPSRSVSQIPTGGYLYLCLYLYQSGN